MIRGNSNDFINHPLPKDFVSAHGASYHACVNPALGFTVTVIDGVECPSVFFAVKCFLIPDCNNRNFKNIFSTNMVGKKMKARIPKY